MVSLNAAGVHLVFLPTYSPELNPCENCFGEVKGRLRTSRGTLPFWLEILLAFSRVSYENMLRFYKKCIYEW